MQMKDKIYEYLKDKKILILGFGKEGKSTYHFLRNYDKKQKLGIADLNEITEEGILKDSNIIFHIGEKYLDACSYYDIIIKGPGVIIKDYLEEAVKTKITCQTDLFLKFCPIKTIGITGTKGKSTTSSLLYHILKELNQNVILMGNIGIPCFDVLDSMEEDSIPILELGCHQLEYMKNSPNIAVILDIYEEHLDHYVSMQNYVDSKKRIYQYQKKEDIVLLGDSPYLQDFTSIISTVLVAKERKDNCFFIQNDKLHILYRKQHNQIPISDIHTRLEGKHNLYNILVCLTIIRILNLDLETALTSLDTFQGLKHRLEYIGTFDDVSYYDDSIATSIFSVIYAVEALKKVDTIIIGGMERGLNYEPLVEFLDQSGVENILLLPATGDRIETLFLEKHSKKNRIKVKNMEEAVLVAKRVTQKYKICLLSPAAASYGFYKNFEERGDHFRMLVENYERK